MSSPSFFITSHTFKPGVCSIFLWVTCGVGKSTRFLLIHTMVAQYGSFFYVLPAVNRLTGSDYTSKVGTEPAALKANPQLFGFGHSIHEPKLSDDVSKAKTYLVHVFRKGTIMFRTMNQFSCGLTCTFTARVSRNYFQLV